MERDLLNSTTDSTPEDFERAVGTGPKGAIVLCGISVALVMAIWFAFYFLAFLPRGLLQ